MHALGQLPDLDAATRWSRCTTRRAGPEDAELYRRLRPLVEQSTLALADVFAALDAQAPAMAGPSQI
jgi:gluconokinase